MNVLAIDQGTSSTKAVVLDDEHRVLGSCTVPVRTHAGADGAVEQDPLEIFDSVLTAGRGAIEAAGTRVHAVGLGNQGETVLRWDRQNGRPLGPAISWQDTRASGVARELAAHSRRLEALTGLPLDPYFAAPKMSWLRRRSGPDGTITTLDAWIARRLVGRAVTDVATASRTMLLDLDRVDWSEEALRLFGLEDEPPALVGCAEVVGETGAFGPTLPVTGLIVDQQAALFGQSCFAAGEAKCTYGTGAFLLANSGTEARRSQAGLAACVAWRLGTATTYCLDGQVYTAGAAISWLQRLGLLGAAADIDDLISGRHPDGELPLFVPALAGLGAPHWQPLTRASWSGLSLATDRADLVAAVVWGIAAQVTTLVRAMEADIGSPLRALGVDGGLTCSAALMQAQADLLQLPVHCHPNADATVRGVAALARLGGGAAATPQDAVGAWTPAAVFEPRMTADAALTHLARVDRLTASLTEQDRPAATP